MCLLSASLCEYCICLQQMRGLLTVTLGPVQCEMCFIKKKKKSTFHVSFLESCWIS